MTVLDNVVENVNHVRYPKIMSQEEVLLAGRFC